MKPNNLDQYRAEIKRTRYGVAHISADDYGSLGYGEGFAAAEDHVCNIAYAVVEARGELARYFGRGDDNRNVISDIATRALDIPGRASRALQLQGEALREWLTGFAAGYNRHIRETGPENITSWCRGAPWVKEITPVDIAARIARVVQTTPRLAQPMVAAHPPDDGAGPVTRLAANAAVDPAVFSGQGMGSNGWSIGSELSEHGNGMLLANPHYPWRGPDRFWEKHLTIPGQLDVYGAGLLGIPGVLIGFNRDVAWTHTVSNSRRLVIYELTLVPGQPTRYFYDDQVREMTSREIQVPIKKESGQVIVSSQTVWFSHHGPILSMPGMEWSETRAYAVRDSNSENHLTLRQWQAMAEARSMDEFEDAHRRWNAMPWVNTIATSRDGRALYMDGSTVANLSDEALSAWRQRLASDPLAQTLNRKYRLPLLDGSDSRFEWQQDENSVIPGVVPFAEKPYQERKDYVFNANDSYWLTNVSAPLSGFSPLYGEEDSPRSLRTRMNALILSDAGDHRYTGADGRFSLQELQDALLANTSLAATLLKEQLASACKKHGATTKLAGETVDLQEACTILSSYDGTFNLDSRGAVLFREWITTYDLEQTRFSGALFAEPFSAEDPVSTPNTLADERLALEKLAHATRVMARAGLELDTTLRETQFTYHHTGRLAVHGGNKHEGVVNLIMPRGHRALAFAVDATPVDSSAYLTDRGYTIDHGSSFILGVSYTNQGPEARALLTYSQSGDPTVLNSMDQTFLFANKQWRTIPYETADVEREAVSTTTLRGSR